MGQFEEYGIFMGFDKGRKGDRGGRGRDKRDDFFGGGETFTDQGSGFQERAGYGGGGGGGRRY
jgi:CspA family cold shock protein